MKLLRKAGSTSQILQVFIMDSSSATGAGLTGLTNASAGLTAYYHRDTDTTATAVSLVTMTVGTFTSSGFKEVDATNMPGWYQFCPPDAAFASGAKSVALHLKGATNMAPLPVEVDLDGQADVTHWNGTAVATPNTAGYPLVDAAKLSGTALTARDIGASVLLSAGAGTGQLDFTSGVVKANATQWLGGTIPAVNVTGVPKVDVVDWLGSAPNALAQGKVDAALNVRNGTAQAGAAGSITLDAGASATDNLYRGLKVGVVSGTGAGQWRLVSGYTGSTKVATVAPNWTTAPDNTSVFVLAAWAAVDLEQWALSAPNALTSGRVDAVVGAYAGGQAPLQPTVAGRTLDVSATGEAGLDWANIGSPTTTVSLSGTTVGTVTTLTGYTTPPTAAAVATAVWTDLLAGSDFATAASIGKLLKDDVDAAVSSRSTYAGADTAGTTTLLSRLSAGRATNLDNLDAAVSSRSTLDAAGVWAAGTRTLTAFGFTVTAGTVTDKTGYALAAGEYTGIADALLKRDMSAVSGEAARSPLNALRFLRNKWSLAGTTLTVTKEDDAATAWTATVTAQAGADPVVGSDPA